MKFKISESIISDLDSIAQHTKDFKSFIPLTKKELSGKGLDFSSKDFLIWLKDLYTQSKLRGENKMKRNVNGNKTMKLLNENGKQNRDIILSKIKDIVKSYKWLRIKLPMNYQFIDLAATPDFFIKNIKRENDDNLYGKFDVQFARLDISSPDIKIKSVYTSDNAKKYTNSILKLLEYYLKNNVTENKIMKRSELEKIVETVLYKVLSEKAVSKAQQKFMGMVHAAQKGEKPASAAVAKVAKAMDPKDVKDFAETPTKGLPNKVKKEEENKDIEIQEKLEKMITSVLQRIVKENKINELAANPNANKSKWDDWMDVASQFEREYDSNPKATSRDLNYFLSDYKTDHKIPSLMPHIMVTKLVNYLNQHGFKNIIINQITECDKNEKN